MVTLLIGYLSNRLRRQERIEYNGEKMTKRKLFLWPLCGGWLLAAFVGWVEAVPQVSQQRSRSPLFILTDGWGPCAPEDEIRIAGYLREQTQGYLNALEVLTEESFNDRAYIDGETANILQLTVSDLKISLKEMITTLALIERLFQQRPADYVQSAPLLWLTVVKDISLEKGNARNIERLGLVKSNWPSIVDISLPRLFSRILEPKLTEFLRRGEKQ